MRVHRYETAFLWVGALMLVMFLGALAYTSVAMGIHLPGRDARIVPEEVRGEPPFDRPGLRQVGENRYELVIIASAWTFQPSEVRIPRGAEVTIVTTSTDVIHGIHIEGTRVNMMVIPGQVARNTFTFRDAGEHLLVCHEYCGFSHHTMFGRVIVE